MPAISTMELLLKEKKTAVMVRLDGCSDIILQITNSKTCKNKTYYIKCSDSNQGC